jgi:hypothetical protein
MSFRVLTFIIKDEKGGVDSGSKEVQPGREQGTRERGDDEYESEDKSRRKRERKGNRDTWDSTRSSFRLGERP